MGGGRGNGKGFDMDDLDPAENAGDNAKPDGKGGGRDGMNSSDDTLLKYIDDDPDSYSNIFDNAKTDVSKSDKKRLIAALKALSGDETPRFGISKRAWGDRRCRRRRRGRRWGS